MEECWSSRNTPSSTVLACACACACAMPRCYSATLGMHVHHQPHNLLLSSSRRLALGKGLDWDALANLQLDAPHIPTVFGDADDGNFSFFRQDSAASSPSPLPHTHSQIHLVSCPFFSGICSCCHCSHALTALSHHTQRRRGAGCCSPSQDSAGVLLHSVSELVASDHLRAPTLAKLLQRAQHSHRDDKQRTVCRLLSELLRPKTTLLEDDHFGKNGPLSSVGATCVTVA